LNNSKPKTHTVKGEIEKRNKRIMGCDMSFMKKAAL